MEKRGRKCTEALEQLASDKRACGAADHRPSSSSHLFSASEPQYCTMETFSSATSISSQSDRDSSTSCDSDEPDHDNHHLHGASDAKTKFKRILSELSADGVGPSGQLAALTELCDILLLCSESSLSGFAWDSMVPVLVNLAKYSENPDIMLFAIRAMTYLCDMVPRSALYLVRYDAVPALVAPLMGIEYLDVAEQCLQALEKISRLQPNACLQAGVIMAGLSYIDFFSTSIQKVVVSLVANICRKLPSDSASYVLDAIPVLCNLLQYEDKKLVESAATCVVKIVESLATETMDAVCKHGLIQQSAHLIALSNQTTLSQSTYTGLIGMLARLASASSVAVKTLFGLNICSALRNILLTADTTTVVFNSELGESISSQVYEALKLLNVLLPPLERSDVNSESLSDMENFLKEQPDLLLHFGTEILPSLIQVIGCGTSSCVCYGCLCVINKLVACSTRENLLELLQTANISSSLANVFARKDRHVLISALKTVELIMGKLPDFYLKPFVKEGVLYAIDALQTPEKCSQSNLGKSDCRVNSSASNQKVGGVGKDVAGCFCYAFDIGGPASQLESATCKIENVIVHAAAKHIKETYLTGMLNSSGLGLSECLKKLRNFSTVLTHNSAPLLESSISNVQHDILYQAMGVINNKQDPVSTFELMESGIVRSFVDYLSGGYFRKESVDYCVLLKRFGIFAGVSLFSTSAQCKDIPLTLLVRKLQTALSLLDHFPVISSNTPKFRSIYSNIPYAHYTKHPCLKIRFMKKEGEVDLGDYSHATQLVEAVSYFDDLERFLWPKVSCSKSIDHVKGDTSKPIDILQADPSKGGVADLEDRVEKDSEGEKSGDDTFAHTETLDMMQAMPGESSCSTSSQETKLIFYMEGKPLDRSLTLYQSILQQLMNEEYDVVMSSRFWNEVYTVTYGKVEGSDASNSEELFSSHGVDSSWQKPPFFIKMLLADIPWELDKSSPINEVLVLLKMLDCLNRSTLHLLSYEKNLAFSEGRISNFDELMVAVPTVPQVEFINCKLSEKLEQQMRDPLSFSAAVMPLWCTQLVTACPFLFSFEARRKYFRLASFSSSRVPRTSLQHRGNYNNSDGPTERSSQSAGTRREKFQVSRDDVLGSAAKMMDRYARSNRVVEVEYIQEVGTGLGPTMEFYTIVSHEFQKVGLGMWREDLFPSVNASLEFVAAPFGLFPRPWSPSCSSKESIFSKAIEKFVLLGQIVGKAIQDGRVLDLPLSKAFYKLVLGQELDICDISTFDPGLGMFLLEFQALTNRNKLLKANSFGDSASEFGLRFRDSRVEDLGLDFTLPGYNDYKLACENDYSMVNINNLEDYVSLVVDATVKSGVSRQIEAFKSGFNQVLPLNTLQIFTEDEFDRLLCGERDTWISGDLLDHIKVDHGYTARSPPVMFLLEIMEEFERDQRRAFLQFVTGAPRLPPGGLAALSPKLTVVRKNCTNLVDGDLPSVMTCANYLKLPPYTTKERMRERLLYAITEGQGSFHLS